MMFGEQTGKKFKRKEKQRTQHCTRNGRTRFLFFVCFLVIFEQLLPWEKENFVTQLLSNLPCPMQSMKQKCEPFSHQVRAHNKTRKGLNSPSPSRYARRLWMFQNNRPKNITEQILCLESEDMKNEKQERNWPACGHNGKSQAHQQGVDISEKRGCKPHPTPPTQQRTWTKRGEVDLFQSVCGANTLAPLSKFAVSSVGVMKFAWRSPNRLRNAESVFSFSNE